MEYNNHSFHVHLSPKRMIEISFPFPLPSYSSLISLIRTKHDVERQSYNVNRNISLRAETSLWERLFSARKITGDEICMKIPKLSFLC